MHNFGIQFNPRNLEESRRLYRVFDRARSGCEDRANFRSVNTQNKHGGLKRWHGYYLERCANTV